MAQLPLIKDSNQNLMLMQTQWKAILDPAAANTPTITEWTSFPMLITATTTNPTKGNISTDQAFQRRVGDTLSVGYNLSASSAGTNGTGLYLFSLPSGLSMDSGKTFTKSVEGLGILGICQVGVPSANVFYNGVVLSYDTTHVSLKLQDPAAASGTLIDVSASFMSLGNTTLNYTFNYSVPIQGWTASN